MLTLPKKDSKTRKSLEEEKMLKKGLIGGTCLLLSVFIFFQPGFSQEDKIGEAAISVFKA